MSSKRDGGNKSTGEAAGHTRRQKEQEADLRGNRDGDPQRGGCPTATSTPATKRARPTIAHAAAFPAGASTSRLPAAAPMCSKGLS